ncbi:MAG: DNA-processing protein DprA, partial [Bacilli bacterium]
WESCYYPALLRTVIDAPYLLFYRGNLSLLSKSVQRVAIVGARECQSDSIIQTQRIVSEFVQKNITIVSGLAKGIDCVAHEKTLEQKGNAIGVVAHGLDWVYPRENRSLFERMYEQGLIISEYPPSIAPKRWMFPARNRIISGLAQGTLVIEAKRRSGSLITAQFALEQGREVYTLPARASDTWSTGNLDLIRDGAHLFTGVEDWCFSTNNVKND